MEPVGVGVSAPVGNLGRKAAANSSPGVPNTVRVFMLSLMNMHEIHLHTMGVVHRYAAQASFLEAAWNLNSVWPSRTAFGRLCSR